MMALYTIILGLSWLLGVHNFEFYSLKKQLFHTSHWICFYTVRQCIHTYFLCYKFSSFFPLCCFVVGTLGFSHSVRSLWEHLTSIVDMPTTLDTEVICFPQCTDPEMAHVRFFTNISVGGSGPNKLSLKPTRTLLPAAHQRDRTT